MISLLPNELPEREFDEISSKEFYREFLVKSRPLLLKGLSREWPAYELW